MLMLIINLLLAKEIKLIIIQFLEIKKETLILIIIIIIYTFILKIIVV